VAGQRARGVRNRGDELTATFRRVRGAVLPPATVLRTPHEHVPMPVQRVHEVVEALDIWYRFSRNSTAMSCRDAAARRERLGSVGIPLWDELKSLALSDGERLIFAHCRGDESIDLGAVATLVGTDGLELAPAELTAPLRMGYGLINPFVIPDAASVPVVQVFDRGLAVPIDVPGTMMTNAGDRTWGIEFRADELIEGLGALVAPIATTDAEAEPRPPAIVTPQKIGIITGNAPESGIVLWELVNRYVRAQLERDNVGDVSMPAVEVQSVPAMGLSMELDLRLGPVTDAIEGAAADLVNHGCTIVAVACNTTQFFTPSLQSICAQTGATFISMPKVVGAWLRSRNIDSIGLVGIRYVSDLGEWSAYREPLEGIAVERPNDHGMSRITEIGYQVKAEGPTIGAVSRLHNVLRDVFESRHVLLALTELSQLIDLTNAKPRSGNKVIIDPLHLYAEAIAAAFTGAPFPPEHHDT